MIFQYTIVVATSVRIRRRRTRREAGGGMHWES
jgi:hypothetical protein